MINIQLGDCLQLIKSIDNDSIDTVVTSPPYNKGYFLNQKQSNQIWNKFDIKYNLYDDNLPIEEYEEFCLNILNELYRVLKPGGSVFWNHKPIRYNNTIYHPLNIVQKSKLNLYQEIIWNRQSSPNIRNDILVPCTERIYWLSKDKPKCFRNKLEQQFFGEVWNISAVPNKEHPAPFPEQLVENCILLTTNEQDTILDPFLGSGTTAISCYKLNRNCIGFELDKTYYDLSMLAIKELENSEALWR